MDYPTEIEKLIVLITWFVVMWIITEGVDDGRVSKKPEDDERPFGDYNQPLSEGDTEISRIQQRDEHGEDLQDVDRRISEEK